jgi:FtsP/CotA-like multicopper oxidase with cupredoxin domain
VELFSDTDTPEFVHWHGMAIPAAVDGAGEEKSLVVPAHGKLRYGLAPSPAGARWLHSHAMSKSDVQRGTYTGQFGFVYVEPKNNPGQYDQEFFLATHEWEPFFELALPGHVFQVVGLDGNAVPRPQPVGVLELGTAERIDAVVEMKTPGVWVLGTPHDDDRKNGMGIVVEYAGKSSAPRWIAPAMKP